ncbi:uncharacterized protein LOC143899566 [Temnothorax americanus]|uniref:uncharacterized protein LOC143899566 n=1 Tax=Temnothorax americanus TaxID=1964332 RepID=UPI004067FCA4
MWSDEKSGFKIFAVNRYQPSQVHFEHSQFKSRRVDGWKKLKLNAVPTLFYVPNPPRRIDSPPRKSPYKKLQNEVAGTCAQKVAEVSITPEMNMDYAAPLNHDVSNEVEISSNIPKSLLSSDSEQTAQVDVFEGEEWTLATDASICTGGSRFIFGGEEWTLATDASICTGGSQFVFGGKESDATQPNRQDENCNGAIFKQ